MSEINRDDLPAGTITMVGSVTAPDAQSKLTEATIAMHTPILKALDEWMDTFVHNSAISANTDVLNNVRNKVSEIKTLITTVWA